MKIIQKSLLSLLLVGCATLSGFRSLNEMSEVQYESFKTRTVSQITAIASAVIAEGDMSQESAMQLAESIRFLGLGTTAGLAGSLSEALDMDSYGVAAMVLVMTELDTSLEQRGAYDEGGLISERAAGILLAIADGIRAVASKETETIMEQDND